MNHEILRAKLIAAIDAILSEHLGPPAPRATDAPSADGSELLSPKELAVRLNVSKSTVQRWIRIGLPHGRAGNTIRIRLPEVQSWLANGGAVAAAQRRAKTESRKEKAA